VWHREGLREVVFLSAIMSFFAVPLIVLLPFYVEDVLKARVDWYGFILAAYSVGTLLGYGFAGLSRLPGAGRSRLIVTFVIIRSLGYAALGLVHTPAVAMSLALLGGFMGGFVTVSITTIMQLSTPGEIRGRVFGLVTAISGSLTPIAMGVAGVVADLVGQDIPLIYLSCGAIMAIATLAVSTNGQFRAILAFEPEGEVPVRVSLPAG
jgi:MFS family permease